MCRVPSHFLAPGTQIEDPVTVGSLHAIYNTIQDNAVQCITRPIKNDSNAIHPHLHIILSISNFMSSHCCLPIPPRLTPLLPSNHRAVGDAPLDPADIKIFLETSKFFSNIYQKMFVCMLGFGFVARHQFLSSLFQLLILNSTYV